MADIRWRTNGVRIVRGDALKAAVGPAGRATAFDFAGSGGRQTWIGTVRLGPSDRTGAHHHGRHEVAVYVASGRGRIRWGERLEFAAEVSAGDFIYFAPFVPHQEANLDAHQPLEFIVVRSDNARIVMDLDVAAVESPELMF